jgi:hypothetical protein
MKSTRKPTDTTDDQLEAICEYSSFERAEGLAFSGAKIIHVVTHKRGFSKSRLVVSKEVSLHESAMLWRRIEGLSYSGELPDGTHDWEARSRWLKMVADALP